MGMIKMTQDKMLESLVHNYNFKAQKAGKLPTIDYVYPSYTADGNTEDFRFSESLRYELAERAQVVTDSFKGKKVVYTLDESVMLEVADIAPRLGLKEQIKGEINSIYSYSPLLFIASDGKDFKAYVVKPVIDYSMAWFELTEDETKKVKENLEKKADKKPYKTLAQRVMGYFGSK